MAIGVEIEGSGALAVLVEDPDFVSSALFWPLWELYTHGAHTCSYTLVHIKLK